MRGGTCGQRDVSATEHTEVGVFFCRLSRRHVLDRERSEGTHLVSRPWSRDKDGQDVPFPFGLRLVPRHRSPDVMTRYVSLPPTWCEVGTVLLLRRKIVSI